MNENPSFRFWEFAPGEGNLKLHVWWNRMVDERYLIIGKGVSNRWSETDKTKEVM